MIDLSFLTEAEQEAILKVLQRDSELKKAEEQRIRQLQEQVNDENELKYKSGQWFYDAKSKRHRDKIHGAELVRASIRKRKKPATIAELSQSSKNKSQRRWVNSTNQDIFVPPELYGVMDAPDETEEDVMASKAESNPSAKKVNFPSRDKDLKENGTASPARQRKNPFNAKDSVDDIEINNEMPNQGPDQVNGQEGKRSGTEPVYATLKKPSKSTSSDQDKDFDMEDALMEPKFLGQGEKIESAYKHEKPLEFGKSYCGVGKMNYASPSATSQPGKVYVSASDILAPETTADIQSYHDIVDDQKPKTQDDDVLKWRRPQTLENEDLLAQPRIEQEFPHINIKEDADTFVNPYPENGNNPKYSPGEYNKDTKYKSIFLRNTPEFEGRQVAPPPNFPVAQNMPLSSRPASESFQTHEAFLRNDRDGRDLPTSANFKVMSLKDRVHDTPREQMSNPSQFQSLKHFWNVEDKNWSKGEVDASPNRILTDVLKRNKPTRADFKQRNSKENPAEDFSLPSSFDSLSEEEQTSQKVASWLAQTPTVYGAGQVDAHEDQDHPAEEVMENIDKTLVDRKNQVEGFPSTLKKQTEDALEAPKIDIEDQKSEEIQISPSKELQGNTTTILVNSAEKQHPTAGFYGRVVQLSNAQTPENKTKTVADIPAMSSKQYSEVEESVERTVAPTKTADEFKIGLQNLMEENESVSAESSDKHQVEGSSLAKEDQQLNEMTETVEKSSVTKGSNHQEFIKALNKLEIEASIPPTIEDPDEQPEKVSNPNAVSPVKSSFKIGFEHFMPDEDDAFKSPQQHNVTYTVNLSPPYNEDVVEKTTAPSRKDENDLDTALEKLEHEATVNYPSAELEDTYEEPKMPFTLQSPRTVSAVQNAPSFDVQSMPSPSRSVENTPNFEGPYSKGIKNPTEEAEDSYVNTAISEEEPKCISDGQESLVEEEPIERTKINTEHSRAHYHNRLMRLEEEWAALSPEEPDESLGEKVQVSPAPTKEVSISKKVISSDESMPPELPPSRGLPEDLSQSQPYAYRELANNPQSPSDKSGSFTGSAGNVPCKKPDTSSEISNSKKGKPAPPGSPNVSNSSKHDRYTFEGLKAQDESISKVLDWFSRSSDSADNQLPSVGLSEKSKTSPQQMATYADPMKYEVSGPGVDDLINGNQASQKMKYVPEMAETLSIENESVPSPQVSLIGSLEFGKSGQGCGKVQSRSINDNSFQKYPQVPVGGVIEKAESFEDEKEDGSLLEEKKASLEKDDIGEPIIDKLKDKTGVLTPTLEPSEDQSSKTPEQDKPIIPQKRVSNIKLLWESNRPSLDATKKSVSRNIKRPFSPVEFSVTPKSSSFDSDDQNNASLVTFKKVMVEDDEDAFSPVPVGQLKSFWENEKTKDTTKGRPDRLSMTNEIWSDDKVAPMEDSRSKYTKRHVVHNFSESKSPDPEKNLPVRSVSVGESVNESVKGRVKPTSFQSLKNFWNVSSKSDKSSNPAPPEIMTKQFGSNPDLTSKEPFMSRAKSRLAAKSLQDIREDPSAVSQLKVYPAEPVARKFSRGYSKKEEPQTSANELETEIHPSNISRGNHNLEKSMRSVDMLQESPAPANYPKSSSAVSDMPDANKSPDLSVEKEMPLTAREKTFAPIRIAKSEISLKLKTSQDEESGKNVSLSEERPQLTTLDSCPDDQTEYRDVENGEINEKGRKLFFVKQSAFDAGSPVLSNVSGSLQENEGNSPKNEYPTDKEAMSDSREVVNENIEKTVPCNKDLGDFDRKLQNLYNESLNTVDSQNGDLTEPEYMDINEPDQNFSKVLAISSRSIDKNIQSSGASKGHQPIIINVSSKKTEIVNEEIPKPQQSSPTEYSLIQHSSFDDPTVLGSLEHQPDISPSEVTNLTSQEPPPDRKGSLSRELEVNELSSEPNDYKNNAPQPEQLSRKEVIERIENTVVPPRTRLNDFDEKLTQLYEEWQNSQSVEEAAEGDNVAKNNEQARLKNKASVYLHSSEPKRTFLKSSTVNLEPSRTTSADQTILTDESAPSTSQAPDSFVQEVNETVEKTEAPMKISTTSKSLEDLQKEFLNEEGGFVGNVPPGHMALESHSMQRDQALKDNSENYVQQETEPTRYEENQEGAQETRGTFMSHRQSTLEKDKNGSLQKSTVELYLEAPYRREISKSIDFDASGYVTSDVNKYQNKLDNQKEDMLAPTENSFPENAEKFKQMSQSVPSFLQEDTDGRETDSASESSFQIGRHKKSPSSLTNLSGSSGMASMSSVSGSVMSVYSGDFGNVDIKGSIEFAMDYVEQLKEFHIFIYQCKDLAAADVKKQRSDPYVKAYLLPEKAKMGKRKTAVKKKTLNPIYNEILRYKIPKQSLQVQTLNLSVWHHDALGRNSFLGEVNQNLAMWDWNNTHRNWYQLEARTPASGIGLENRGEMKLSLKYIPVSAPEVGKKLNTTGEVHIWIKECIQLPMLRENKINSFVKCTILPDTSRKSRQKTRMVDKTPNPIFNHTMVYDGFKEEDLKEACVELTVWDHNKLSNHFLGGLRIGLGTGKSYGTVVDWMDSSHEEATMWEKMIASPNTWIEGMLPLRMFKMAKLNK